jgi:translation initiation factor 6
MKVIQTSFHGDHNLGLFAKSCDKFCLIGNFVQEKTIEKVKEVMKIDVLKTTVANTDFVGMFSSFNSNGIVLPNIITPRELSQFKNLKKEFGINLEILKTKFTALGNIILCNDKGAVISKNIKKVDKKRIEDCFGAEVEYGTISSMSTVGSCGVATNKGCLIHRDANENEIEKIQQLLKVETDIGTANFGSPFIGACCFANSVGAVVGESTTGPEITRIMETLGFL